MLLHSLQDPRLCEQAFRCVQNANTLTATITARTIAVGGPVILATATASLPGTDPSLGQNFVVGAGAAAGAVNNLLVGILARAPGTLQYLDAEDFGLAQCYGVGLANFQAGGTAGTPGQVLIPDTGGLAAPGTAPAVAMGGLIVLMEAVATSSGVTKARVFLRCM